MTFLQVPHREIIAAIALALVTAACYGGEPATLTINGCSIQFMDHATLAAERQGVVAKLLKQEGDLVTAGEAVATLVDDVARAQLAVLQAEAINDAELRAMQVQAGFARQKADKAIEANRKLAGTISPLEVDFLKAEAEKAVASVDRLKNELTIKCLKRDQLQKELAAYTIRAPFAGVVTATHKNLGEAVAAGEKVLDLCSVERVKVEGYVSIAESMKLHRGLAATVKLDTTKTPELVSVSAHTGKLVFVDPGIKPVSGQVRVWAEVANPRLELRAGLKAQLQIRLEQPVPVASTQAKTSGVN